MAEAELVDRTIDINLKQCYNPGMFFLKKNRPSDFIYKQHLI
ncbi:hypothetical protein [Microcoleus sp. SVA1B1]